MLNMLSFNQVYGEEQKDTASLDCPCAAHWSCQTNGNVWMEECLCIASQLADKGMPPDLLDMHFLCYFCSCFSLDFCLHCLSDSALLLCVCERESVCFVHIIRFELAL